MEIGRAILLFVDSKVKSFLGERLTVKLRIVAGARHRANIGDMRHAMRVQQWHKRLEGARRMPHGKYDGAPAGFLGHRKSAFTPSVLSYKFADKFQFPPDASATCSTAILAVYIGRMPMLRTRPAPHVGMKYATEFATQDTSTPHRPFSRLMKKGFDTCHPECSEGSRHFFSRKYWDASLRSA